MVTKKDEKKGKIGFESAQSSRNPILGKTGSEMDAEESEFSDVQTGHWKLDTGNKEIKIGPAEKYSVSSCQFPVFSSERELEILCHKGTKFPET